MAFDSAQTRRALSIRQPYAELILRGMKTIEYRSRATTILGERFWIYASKGKSKLSVASGQWPVKKADNVVAADVPPWMVELANALRLFPEDLPTGVIVGSAVIEKVVKVVRDPLLSPAPLSPALPTTYYEWHLADVERAKRLLKPRGHPQPVWWRPG